MKKMRFFSKKIFFKRNILIQNYDQAQREMEKNSVWSVTSYFSDLADHYAGLATLFKLQGEEQLYQLNGAYNGMQGIYEWIIDPKLGGVTHRRFIKNGKTFGIPNQDQVK